jgi:hypothetical protein
MTELKDFYNAGAGWICRQCDRELSSRPKKPGTHSRIFNEGEAESKTPELANPALAKWTDKSRRYLTCPRCGITEMVDIS